MDLNRPALWFSAGMTLDIAPFGLEQTFFSLQSEITSPGTVALAFKPSFLINSDVTIIRLPLILKWNKGFFSLYGGGGLEMYFRDGYHDYSPLLTAGVQFNIESFFIDIPLVTIFHSYNRDSDISLYAGYRFYL